MPVPRVPHPAHAPLLEVIVLDATEARTAVAAGADRLELVSAPELAGLTPSPRTVAAVRNAVSAPVRVMLRPQDGFAAGDLDALRHDTRAVIDAGADEFVLGFLDPAGGVDLPAMHAVLDVLDGRPWTFHKAIDAAPDRDACYTAIHGLPGLDTVLTSGGPFPAGSGINVLRREAERTASDGGPRLLVGGGLREPDVAPLRAAGLREFHIGTAARGTNGWSSPIDGPAVRRWRELCA
jgi:copper homeostasis protein